MAEMQVHATITPGDMEAAVRFMDKRIRRRDDILEGISAALFSVMFATGECLTESGLPVSEVERLFQQFASQVVWKLHGNTDLPEGRA